MYRPIRTLLVSIALAGLIGTLGATGAIAKNPTGIVVSSVVDVTGDTTSQNESPLAVNPTNPMNMITGNNDWNFNDGCGMNVTFDGGKTWTPSLANRSTDGGKTWLASGLTQVSAWNGNGKSRGGNGQFPDHESIHVDMSPTSPFYGSVYVTWAQFDGFKGTHSPVYVAVSRDGARTFSTPAKVNLGSIR